MIIKIADKEADNLKEGDIIIRYPMNGETTDDVDITNRNEFKAMTVGRIFEDDIDLLFGVSDVPIFDGAMQVKVGPLHKTKTQLIEEKRWWLYKK